MTDSGHIGYDLLSMRSACAKMEPYQRQDCPVCAYPLETAADGIRHCRFCGWVDENAIVRDVPRP